MIISIICPVFNEENCVEKFFDAINKVKNKINNYQVELIFTNNASTDGTLKKLSLIASKNKWVKVITLKRNYGYQNSLFCGLEHAKGDLITMIDCDLQDPPEMLIDFIKYSEEGYEVVYGIRKDREENLILKKVRHLWYLIVNKIADQDFVIDMAEFCMVNKQVKDILIQNKSTHIFLRNEIAYGGYKRKGIEYKRKERVDGKAQGASLVYMFKFAIAGILTASTFPLRLISYLFLILAPLNLLLFLFNIDYFKIILILDLIILIYANAIIGIYLARVHKDIIQRPRYLINRSQCHNLNEID